MSRPKRIVFLLHAPAEERYRPFLEMYPSLIHRVLQHMLASYLGMTQQTLSHLHTKTTEP